MSIFGSIIGKIFGSNPAKAAPAEPAADEPAAVPAASEVVPAAPAAASPEVVAAAPVPAAPDVVPTAAVHVDVAKILDNLNEANPETLDWRVSIVDLLKVLGLDSSLAARKQLAAELKFEGDAEDSTTLNVWLHQRVIDLIAANGGEIPAELLKK